MSPAPYRDPELSPELVLVSPELAREARANLPDRPWEAFAPPRPPVLELAPPEVPAAQRAAALARRRRVAPALTALAILALLIAGFLPASDAPTLEPPTPSGPPAPTPGALYGIDARAALVVSGDGGSIARVTSLPCLRGGAVLDALIAADGSFGIIRTFDKPTPRIRVELSGVFIGSTDVRGNFHVRSPVCDSGVRLFTAHRR